MNNTRRKVIRTVIKELRTAEPDWDWVEAELNGLLSEESDALENIPESLQDTDRYMVCEESVDYLEEAHGYVDPDDEDAAKNVIEVLEQIDGI